MAAHDRPQPDGRSIARGRAPADIDPALVRRRQRVGRRWGGEADADALERVLAGGAIVAGAVPPTSPEMAAALGELRASLQTALAEMPEDERIVIVLAYGEDLSQSEIAERLGWPLGTVKTRTRRALARLRAVLGSGVGPEFTRYLAPASSAGPDH